MENHVNLLNDIEYMDGHPLVQDHIEKQLNYSIDSLEMTDELRRIQFHLNDLKEIAKKQKTYQANFRGNCQLLYERYKKIFERMKKTWNQMSKKFWEKDLTNYDKYRKQRPVQEESIKKMYTDLERII